MSKARNLADIVSNDIIDTDANGVTIVSTGAIRVPIGTEAQRPSAAKGQFRFNDDVDTFEGYNGVEWGPIGGGGYTASSTAPSTPSAGDEWWDTDDGAFYKYINDGTTSQWVEWGPNNSLNGNELITGNLIPDVDAAYDIGSSNKTLANIYATASSAKYADLAENFLADDNYPVGTVLMLGGTAEVTVAVSDSTAVVGTVSAHPAYLMNSGLTGEHVVPVAYIGRVPCRVVGAVNRGDFLIVSEVPGVACASDKYLPGQTIGKAIEAYNSVVAGTIEILVGRL